MKNSIRASALAIALATGITVGVPLALPAGAALKPSVTCSKLTAGFVGKVLKTTISQCTPAALAKGGPSASGTSKSGPTSGKTVMTITWAGGKGTTKSVVNYKPAKGNGKCASPSTRVAVTGSVSSATGAAAAITKKGEPLTISICAITSGPKLGSSSLEPGTKLKL